MPALEYAAKRGVLGAEVSSRASIPRSRPWPRTTPRRSPTSSAIADQYADIRPTNPIAQYVGEAFDALGQYHLDGIPA